MIQYYRAIWSYLSLKFNEMLILAPNSKMVPTFLGNIVLFYHDQPKFLQENQLFTDIMNDSSNLSLHERKILAIT